MAKVARCDLCKFWDSYGEEDGRAPCRRHAPQRMWSDVERSSFSRAAVWPATNGDQWCGDYMDWED